MNKQSVRVVLECHHELWFSVPPERGERIWCHPCNDYMNLYGDQPQYAESIEDDVRTIPKGRNKFDGECLVHVNNNGVVCGFVLRNVVGLSQLKRRMHSHQMRQHTRHGAQFEYADVPPVGQRTKPYRTQPPF